MLDYISSAFGLLDSRSVVRVKGPRNFVRSRGADWGKRASPSSKWKKGVVTRGPTRTVPCGENSEPARENRKLNSEMR